MQKPNIDNPSQDNKILLTNIQRFCLHDGPGIRTTVFLKGCSLRCPWCSNPENLSDTPQRYVKDGVDGMYGKYVTDVELVNECLKDKGFYASSDVDWNITRVDEIEILPGGVTFSGGECLLQMEKLVSVCESLHRNQVHLAVETSLFAPPSSVSLAIQHIDFFYVDVKILDEVQCRVEEKGNLSEYLKNIDIVLCSEKPVVIRIPVIGGYTDDKKNRKLVYALLEKYKTKILKVELIKGHRLGDSKYSSLGMPVPVYNEVSEEVLEQYKEELCGLLIPAEICRI